MRQIQTQKQENDKVEKYLKGHHFELGEIGPQTSKYFVTTSKD